jgi:transcriptional regulator with XRE-family HTH domain
VSQTKKHWTEGDVESYAFRIAFDFVTYVSLLCDEGKVSQGEIARRLGVTEGRVSQILNNPGNLTLKQIVRVARAIDRKVCVVPYDDGDSLNESGPINAAIFTACWEQAGKPTDFYELNARSTVDTFTQIPMPDPDVIFGVNPDPHGALKVEAAYGVLGGSGATTTSTATGIPTSFVLSTKVKREQDDVFLPEAAFAKRSLTDHWLLRDAFLASVGTRRG